MKAREPATPLERRETVRRQILALLAEHTLSAREISGRVRVSEKEVCEHLDHIRRMTHGRDARLVVTPAECRTCGFVFGKRERMKKPGRCPVCRGESIAEPLFSLGGRKTPTTRSQGSP